MMFYQIEPQCPECRGAQHQSFKACPAVPKQKLQILLQEGPFRTRLSCGSQGRHSKYPMTVPASCAGFARLCSPFINGESTTGKLYDFEIWEMNYGGARGFGRCSERTARNLN